MQKKISIILPTYNGGDRIGKSIKSVQDQSFQDWELIIVIDGSTDATFERVSRIAKQDSRIVIINNEQNQGIQKTLNDGLKKATGEYIARIDDDDVWIDVRKLQKQIDFLEQNPDYVLVGTGIILVDSKGVEITRYFLPKTDQDIRKRILGQNCFAHPSVMYRKSVINQIGNYSESVQDKHVEDYEFWLRMGTIGKFANLSEYSLLYQVANSSISGKNKLPQLKKCIHLSWRFRKDYELFYRNFFIVCLRYVAYGLFGGILSRSIRLRGKITSFVKKIF